MPQALVVRLFVERGLLDGRPRGAKSPGDRIARALGVRTVRVGRRDRRRLERSLKTEQAAANGSGRALRGHDWTVGGGEIDIEVRHWRRGAAHVRVHGAAGTSALKGGERRAEPVALWRRGARDFRSRWAWQRGGIGYERWPQAGEQSVRRGEEAKHRGNVLGARDLRSRRADDEAAHQRRVAHVRPLLNGSPLRVLGRGAQRHQVDPCL